MTVRFLSLCEQCGSQRAAVGAVAQGRASGGSGLPRSDDWTAWNAVEMTTRGHVPSEPEPVIGVLLFLFGAVLGWGLPVLHLDLARKPDTRALDVMRRRLRKR